MDSSGIIQIFLVSITVAVIAGFTGTFYFLSRIYEALAGQQPTQAPRDAEAGEEQGIVAQPIPVERTKSLAKIDPRTMGSLEETLGAISKKYSLASFTLATTDGLLIGSTKPGSEGEAARYSYLYTQGKLHDEAGAELLGIPCRGETVVGIIHPSEHLSAEQMNALEQDVQDSLQHWV
ncbi:hypothetical protein HL657_10345 [Methanoculleus sp. YWC-01]|jgi:hypothetical protein|uniref:Uncharacterized protein n=1 Tax=Methanoculleus nereidis TaxID=2735141 RepID=A0ABU3Z4S5_9EURY|nr:hypothetical protein [Methanoculleus sp. YWC-01]MCK9297475.1 hypothetical protein [Methanoculleus sp.]MDV4343559.1 hypothetical protein [Methanoculleus sp. YWC-01]PKL57263.1 MAG: hypothetical protein CVV35_01050 [Methanomicrobiales archaeon HGW-Methanomicrobiales-6]